MLNIDQPAQLADFAGCYFLKDTEQRRLIEDEIHEHEDILAKVLPFQEAWALLQDGAIQNSPAIIALQWLALNRDRLRQDWL